MTRVEAYLAYKAGVIAESDLKPSLKTNFYSGLENWLAYWCGLTADYPKDENNDPKWYTEEEYYVAYLCGIAADYPVNCYRRVGAYLRYIISARWGRPEKPLTREEYYLSLISTTYLSPNEPASIISIDGTAEAPFGDLKIYGDTSQQTYTGKNLANVTQTAQEDNGITSTRNGGEVTLTGTATAISICQLTNYFTCKAGTTYTMSANNPVANSNVLIRLYRSSGPSRIVQMSTVNSYGSFTFTEDESVRIEVRVSSGAAITDSFVFKPQLEIGASSTSYEPYVGGIPSPNPNYPQDIQVVTGRQTVKSMGKNLCSSATVRSNAHIDFVADCATITSNKVVLSAITNATVSNASVYVFVDDVDLHQGAGIFAGTAGERGYAVLTFQQTVMDAIRAGKTLKLDLYRSGAGFSSVSNAQIELGDQMTDYEPYRGQSYTIDLGAIELCKIGTYQDYIWKDGDDWKIHKEIGYDQRDCNIAGIALDAPGASTVSPEGAFLIYKAYWDSAGGDYDGSIALARLSTNCGQYVEQSLPANTHARSMQDGTFCQRTGTNDRIYFRFSALAGKTGDEVKAILQAQGGAKFYYALATPTNTAITNTALIAQLNALLEGGSYNHQTNIVVSAADPNLPGLLQVTAAKWQ